MSDLVGTLLEAGDAALAAGDWVAADAAFARAADEGGGPAAMLGLGEARYWQGDPRARDLLARAHSGARRADDPVTAATAAVYMVIINRVDLGSPAAARGWLARLERLTVDPAMAPFAVWGLLLRALLRGDSGDPEGGLALAREAGARAAELGDPDLELCALAATGELLVLGGRIERGMAALDEAMAGALAGGSRPDTVVFASCTMITACTRAAQFARAAQWIRAGRDFAERYGAPYLASVCRVNYGAVLFATGRWSEAEVELTGVVERTRLSEPALFAEALARLAELRLAQGRIEEAASLLAGIEDRLTSIPALAGIALARGAHADAERLLRRRLRAGRELCLEVAALVELLGEVELAAGSGARAAVRARRLARLAAEVGCDLVAARAERTLGRIAAAGGRPGAAAHLASALEIFARLEMPFETARTHLMLAVALARGAPAEAIAEARAAVAGFETLGAARMADEGRALLRALGVRSVPSGPRGSTALTPREREVLGLLAEGMPNREIARRLHLTRKTVEHHVHSVLVKLDLRSRAEAAAYVARTGGRDPATI